MKIPNSVKIGAFRYDVVFSDELYAGKNFFAEIDHRKLKITLDSQLNPQRFFEGLIHEVIEAISSENDLNLSHPIISTLGTSITSFLLENNLLEVIK